jgi:arginyl-tRNA synthetase
MFKDLLTSLVQKACQELGFEYPGGVIITEPPAHIPGDYSVNIALQLAKSVGKPPREVADMIAEKLRNNEDIAEVTLAGPGFINVAFDDEVYHHMMRGLSQGTPLDTVKLPKDKRQRISVEYVSANPSGPLTVGNARGGPLGEAISRVLEAQGHTVTREFYVNDIGGQANRFGASVLHFYAAEFGQELPFPEDGYMGEYVKDLAKDIAKEDGRSILDSPAENQVEAIRQVAIARMVEQVKHVVARLGITFDRWFWQSSLHHEGKLLETLYTLKANGMTMEKDGAVWLKSGVLEGDRESVLVKSDGTTTYFLDDIAYHEDKLISRKSDRAVCLLGADHSGHPPRMRAGIQALGLDPDRYQAVVYQYVQLKENGQIAEMSKRAGKFVTAAQVLDEVPKDVFTFFMVSKSNDTHVDFDLQLAKDTSEKNPVYSIQYAHARICSVLKKAHAESLSPALPQDALDLEATERALVRQLASFSETVAEAAEHFRINLISQYLTELSARYHQFYAHNRVIQAELPHSTEFRLLLSKLTKETLAAGLSLLHISAPDQLTRD